MYKRQAVLGSDGCAKYSAAFSHPERPLATATEGSFQIGVRAVPVLTIVQAIVAGFYPTQSFYLILTLKPDPYRRASF